MEQNKWRGTFVSSKCWVTKIELCVHHPGWQHHMGKDVQYGSRSSFYQHRNMGGFPKLEVPFFGGLHNKDYSYQGLCWGPLI